MIVRNFLFHRVSPGNEQWAIPMPPDLFEKCIRHITSHYHVQTIEGFLMENKAKQPSSKPIACVSFDDGFKDNIEYAAPILEKYGCHSSFYVVTDCIDKNIPTWTHIYSNTFISTKKLFLKLSSGYLEKPVDIKFSSPQERINFGNQFFGKIKKIPHTARQEILIELYRNFDDVSVPENYMMSWNDINQLQKAGFTIGSHTKTHPLLSTLKSDEDLLQELEFSGNRIMEMCGAFPETISYPVGDFDKRVMELSGKAGYTSGLAVGQRNFNTETDDKMSIPRVDIHAGQGWIKTYMRMAGITDYVKKLIRR
ncbi:MAG TPA: polysaccharide deacetylase family protein [Bacteroidia bacterium]|jgi:peptidoglycan/xylan/chitin deacetylase (PgdA/CDA1 family)|nr:polysaccharide deacetylase family protein [Bacteroidia bacterium]